MDSLDCWQSAAPGAGGTFSLQDLIRSTPHAEHHVHVNASCVALHCIALHCIALHCMPAALLSRGAHLQPDVARGHPQHGWRQAACLVDLHFGARHAWAQGQREQSARSRGAIEVSHELCLL
jgi:hypothetical protein